MEGDEDEGWKRINVCRPFMDRLEIKVMMIRISKLDNVGDFVLRRRQKCCPRKKVLCLRHSDGAQTRPGLNKAAKFRVK